MPCNSIIPRNRTTSTSTRVTLSISIAVGALKVPICALKSSKCSRRIRPVSLRSVFPPSELFSILKVILRISSVGNARPWPSASNSICWSSAAWSAPDFSNCLISASLWHQKAHRTGSRFGISAAGSKPGFRTPATSCVLLPSEIYEREIFVRVVRHGDCIRAHVERSEELRL